MTIVTRSDVERSLFVYVKDANTDVVKRVAINSDAQIGTVDNPSELMLTGRLSLANRTYTTIVGDNGYVYVAENDTIMSVIVSAVPASGTVTVYLPSRPRVGEVHFIKDAGGTASTTPISITTLDSTTIDGSTSQTISTDYETVAVYWTGSEWLRLVYTTAGGGGGGGAPTDATYVVLSTNATLTKERTLSVSGSNLSMTDAGANSTVSLDLTQILGGGAGTFTNATVTADTYGRITAISAGTGIAPNSASYVTVNAESSLSNERVLSGGIGITITDTGTAVIIDAPKLGSGSFFPKLDHLFIVSGQQIVDQTVFSTVGAVEFNPTGSETMAPSGSTQYSAFFQPIVDVYPTGAIAEVRLYNATTNAVVTNTLLSCSSLTPERLKSANLTGSLVSGNNVYLMQMRLQAAGPDYRAYCKGAKLFVTWS